MTEKLLTFSSPTPSPTSPDPGKGVNRSKFNFFQNSINKPTKTFVPGQHARIKDFFVGGGGGGSRLLNLFYSLQRGSNGFITHFPGGGGPTFPRRGGPISIETHITITCDFPGGLDPLYPYLDPRMYNVALCHE